MVTLAPTSKVPIEQLTTPFEKIQPGEAETKVTLLGNTSFKVTQ